MTNSLSTFVDIDDIFSITSDVVEIFSAHKNGGDAMLLFFKLAKIRREKGGKDMVFANRSYLLNAMNSALVPQEGDDPEEKERKKKLMWGRERLISAKNVLKEHGMIEDVEVRMKNGRIGYRLALSLTGRGLTASGNAVSGKAVHGGKIQKNPVSPLTGDENEGMAVYGLAAHGEAAHGHNKEEDIDLIDNNNYSRVNAFKTASPKTSEDFPVPPEKPVPPEESDKYVHSVEEFRRFVNEGKHAESCPYKVGDESGMSNHLYDCFTYYNEQIKKPILKSMADGYFRRWLFPKHETQKDIEALEANWEARKKAKARKAASDDSELIRLFAEKNPKLKEACLAKAREFETSKDPKATEPTIKSTAYSLLKRAYYDALAHGTPR